MLRLRSLILLLLVALCSCGMNRARLLASEVTAIQDLKSIQIAQVQYSSQFGRFASNLAELQTAGLVPATLGAGQKNGYKFTMTGTEKTFAVNASPTAFGETGSRTFYTDQTLAIRENRGSEPATANSPELK